MVNLGERRAAALNRDRTVNRGDGQVVSAALVNLGSLVAELEASVPSGDPWTLLPIRAAGANSVCLCHAVQKSGRDEGLKAFATLGGAPRIGNDAEIVQRGVHSADGECTETGRPEYGAAGIAFANAHAALTLTAMAVELENGIEQLQVTLSEGAANTAAGINGTGVCTETEDERPREFPAPAVIALVRPGTVLVGKNGENAAGEWGGGSQNRIVGRTFARNVGGAGEINEINRMAGARTRSDAVAGHHRDLAIAPGGAIDHLLRKAGDTAGISRTETL